jgi:hypothetical protein
MGSRYQIGGWPVRPHIFGNVSQVHAIGQVTLAYNHLESYLGLIFRLCMPTDVSFSERLFYKMNNRDRIDLLAGIIRSSRFHNQAKDRLNYLLQCYNICTENRNILMHATAEEAYAGVLHISKRSSNDPMTSNRFQIPLAELRMVADQMHTLSAYMMNLQFWLAIRNGLPTNYKNSLALPPIEKIPFPKLRHLLRALPEIATLPEKPPKPRRLIPSRPPKARPTGKPQPRSSRA